MTRRSTWMFVLPGLAVAVGLAVFVSPLASSSPDGLERVAEDKGFADKEASGDGEAWKSAPVPDYEMPGVKRVPLAKALAGLAGTLVTFLVGWGVARLAARRNRPNPAAGATDGEGS
ncbi:MAG: hypothetical protein BIFFINMI_01231 [Phycisphaerae bacterium]|nr:hypothetical protein [Phycisphaerae bacterium]